MLVHPLVHDPPLQTCLRTLGARCRLPSDATSSSIRDPPFFGFRPPFLHDFLHSFFLISSCSSADILSSKTKTSIRSFYRIFSMAPLIKFCFSLHGGQQPLLLPVRALDDLLELLLIRFHSFLHDRILPCVCHQFSFVLTNTNLMCSFSLHALLAWTSTIPVTSVGHSKYASQPSNLQGLD